MRAFAPFASLRRFASATPAWIGLALAVAASPACNLNPIKEACTVTIAPNVISVTVNGAVNVSGTAFDCDGSTIRDKKISFSSANVSVATVTPAGQIIGVSVGQTTVSAVANGKTGTAQVTVTPEQATTVTVSPATFTLRTGQTRAFTGSVKNAAGTVITGKTLRWSSSNSSTASVDQSGNVTALATGNVVIAAEVDAVTGTASLNVTLPPIGSCSLSPATQRVTVSAQAQPTVTLRDTAPASNVMPTQGRPFVWTSDNEVVATVSGTGVIRAIKAGTAKIRASSVEYPGISCETSFEAVDPRIVSAVISPKPNTLRLGVPRQFTAALTDSIGQAIPPGRVVTWTSVTPAIASVSATGTVTGLSLGAARIAVRADNAVDTVGFTITKVPVSTVRLSPLSSSVVQGQTVQLTATVEDSTGATVTDRVIEWVSSDATRATVSSTGLVTTTSSGTVTISATSETRSGSASVTIQPIPVDTIVADSTYSVATNAVSKTFAITLKDAAGNQLFNRQVAITSSTPGVAQGTANGAATVVTVTTFNTAGTTILTLRALNANGQPEGKATRVTVTVTLVP